MKTLKVFAWGIAGLVGSLNASILTGDTVHVTFNYPSTSSVFTDLGTGVIPNTYSGEGDFTLSVTDNTLTANFQETGSFSEASFRRFRIDG